MNTSIYLRQVTNDATIKLTQYRCSCVCAFDKKITFSQFESHLFKGEFILYKISKHVRFHYLQLSQKMSGWIAASFTVLGVAAGGITVVALGPVGAAAVVGYSVLGIGGGGGVGYVAGGVTEILVYGTKVSVMHDTHCVFTGCLNLCRSTSRKVLSAFVEVTNIIPQTY